MIEIFTKEQLVVFYKNNEDNISKCQNGAVFTSNSCGDFEIIGKNGNEYVIKFLKTSYVRCAHKSNILAGNVNDPYFPSVRTFGFVGSGDYFPAHKKKCIRNGIIC